MLKAEYVDDLTDELIEGAPNTLDVTLSSGQRKTLHLSDDSLQELLDESEKLSSLVLSDD